MLISRDSNKVGGHAFAVVGFTGDGFIVQNSWGPAWGYHGFAILTYEDSLTRIRLLAPYFRENDIHPLFTPLLGMEWSWKTKGRTQDQWASDLTTEQALADWSVLARKMTLSAHTRKREYVPTGPGRIRLTHGSFDNDLEVVSAMLQRMRGGSPLKTGVENLDY